MRWLGTRRRRWVMAGILFGIIALTVLLNFRRGPSAAERWMEARRAQGEKFTLEELGWDHRRALENPVMEVIEDVQGALVQFPRPSGPSEAFVGEASPGQAYVLWQQPHMVSRSHFQASWSVMEDQLQIVEPALAEIRAAVATIVRDPGGSYMSTTRPINFVALREAAQVLADAVVLELHRAQPDRALTNLVTLTRLSRQHEEHYWLVSQMIRVAITGLATDMTWQVLQSPDWTDAQLEAVQRELTQCRLLDSLTHAIELERALGLHRYETLKKNGAGALGRALPGAPTTRYAEFREHLHMTLWRQLWSNEDLQFFLDYHQASLEAMRGLAHGDAWAPLQQSLQEPTDSDQPLTGRFLGFRYTVSLLGFANYRRALGYAAATETRRRLALVAIALERYRLQHEEWPPDLDALVPECLRELPLDPYSAQPFRYRPEASGPPWLYSVGANGQDDGGNAEPVSEPREAAAWTRDLDLVWPRPVVLQE